MDAPGIRLVVNADDFGLSRAISDGILMAHRQGIVTSTSLLGNCVDLATARDALRLQPALGVGVHVALVEGEPLSPPGTVASLLGPDGKLLARGQDFVTAWLKGRILAGDVEREIDAQVGRIRDAGVEIDHLDTHHHLGFLPVVGHALEQVARRHGIAGIRSAVERPTLAWVTEPRRGLEASMLTGLAWLTRRRMGALRHGPQSWGYVESGRLDEVRILEIIGRLGPGAHELICHPGNDEAGGDSPPDRQNGAPEPRARYERGLEVQALTSPKVRRAIEQRGITLCRWGDLF